MKKIILSALLIFVIFSIKAQLLPNAGFENWDSNEMYENPSGYSTSNNYLYPQTMETNVNKQTPPFSGSYSVWLETKSAMGFALPGFIIYGDPGALLGGGSILSIEGGFPYSQMPDSFNFYARHQCSDTDSAYVLVILKKMVAGTSVPISLNIYKLSGVQNTYKSYSFGIMKPPLPIMPDTAIIAFSSSNPLNIQTGNITVGNWLEVDKISFKKNVGAANPIPNNDFEQWDMVAQVEPQGWGTLNILDVLFFSQPQGVVPVAPGYSGKVAAKITSNLFDFGGPESDTFRLLMLGEMNSDNPGMAIIDNPDSISFWYKYNNAKNIKDSGYVFVSFTKFNASTTTSEQIDSVGIGLAATSAFTRKIVKFPNAYGKSPDSMQLVFSSSKLTPTGRGIGNYLIVDDVVLWSHYVGIAAGSFDKANSFVYPNPASDYVNVRFELKSDKRITLSLLDMNGRQIKISNYSLSSGNHNLRFDLPDVANGNYLIVLGDGEFSLFSKQIVVNK
jgi:hypothetical protein